MMAGLHPRIEGDLMEAIDERPVAFPLAMLAMTVVVALTVALVMYGVTMLSASAPVEMVEHTANPDAALDCIRRCIPGR